MEAIGEKGNLDTSERRPLEDVSSGFTRFAEGDVVVAKITPCFENGKGAVIRDMEYGIGFGTTELHVLTPGPEMDARFLYYVTASAVFRRLGEAAMTGAAGQKRVPEEFVRDFRTWLPDLDEQRRIAAYLDVETAQIDALIAEKRRMLALLEEKRAALVSRAVTRGLDPDVPMKPSGLEWLGDIPAHWELMRLRWAVESMAQGWSPQASNLPATEDGAGVLKLSAISRGRFFPSENKALDTEGGFPTDLGLRRGDVLVTRSNTPELVGDACSVPADFPSLLIPDLVYRLRLKRERLDPEYLASFLLTPMARTQIRRDARGSSGTMIKLSQEHILNWMIPVPPLREQRAIVECFDVEGKHIKQLTAALEQSVTLLGERRSALITAAVTGQLAPEVIRVRGPVTVAAPSPA
jgi:type I restriction enzyme S subunit